MKLIKRNSSHRITDKDKYISLKKTHILTICVIAVALGFGIAQYDKYKRVKGTTAYDIQRSELNLKNELSKLVSIDKTRHKLYFNIKQTEMNRLYKLRNDAIKAGHLYRSEDDYISAKIKFKNQSIPIKFRLKGDHIDHLEGNKWSFRVKIKGNHAILGMKKFSIQEPSTRNYISEWMFMNMLRDEGLIALRYHFVRVYINGKDKGIFALEEHFDKRLVENNRHKEGPIIKFNEDAYWKAKKYNKIEKTKTENLQRSKILPFNSDDFTIKTGMNSVFQKALQLMEAFRSGKLKSSEVFNLDDMAKYLAITDLLGSHHGSIWHNSRFYYNPITSKFSPVGYDAGGGRRIRYIHGTLLGKNNDTEPFNELLMQDSEFFKKYISHLSRIGSEKYLKTFLNKFKEDLKLNEDIIGIDNIRYKYEVKNYLYNIKMISDYLTPQGAARAYIQKVDGNTITVTVGNIFALPIEIINIEIKGKKYFSKLKSTIPGKEHHKSTSFQRYSFDTDLGKKKLEKIELSNISLNYRIFGTDKIKQVQLTEWQHDIASDFQKDFLRTPSKLSNFKFLQVNQQKKQITIKQGHWRLSQGLIIPRGYQVIANEGVSLDLVNKGLFVSYSPLQFIGTKNQPIRFSSSDKKGQGLVVFNSEIKSILKNVIFSNLSNPRQGKWSMSGSVSFYESEVSLENIKFINNSSEDALNIIRSNFTMKDSNFKNTFSDAFDSDFSNGKIQNVSFENIGNDAVDVSNTHLDLKLITMTNISDKAISAGESSTIKAKNISVTNAELGIVSKDNSKVIISNSKMLNTKVPFCAFQKKIEYGPGFIHAMKTKVKNFQYKELIEKKSKLILDNKEIHGKHKDIKKILYGIEFGKKTVK